MGGQGEGETRGQGEKDNPEGVGYETFSTCKRKCRPH